MKVGFLGTGVLADNMIRYLVQSPVASQIRISQRNRVLSAKLCDEFAQVAAGSNEWVVQGSDVIFVCMLAQQARQVLPTLDFSPDQQLISVMAEASLGDLKDWVVGTEQIFVTAPLPFVRRQGCPLPVFPENADMATLFGADHYVLTAPNAQAMTAYFVAASSLATVLTQLDSVAQWLNSECGDGDGHARRYVVSMVQSCLNCVASEHGDDLLGMAQALSTTGGLSEQLNREVEASDHYRLLQEGLDGLKTRISPNGHK